MADAAEQVQAPGSIHAGVPNILVREGTERTGEARTRQPLPGVTDRERRRWRQIQHTADPVRAGGAHPSPRGPNVEIAAQHLADQTGQCGVAQLVPRSEEHTSELQSQSNLVCRLLLEKKKTS